ncbi:MAG: class I tRNA ligase family protein [Actinomycetota bacterium]|nr:class I tRNA ligase family protein [Actinomycetota bacterium]MDQ2956558.1 class I tRNA ligase family protein [Actinomycetota bacterium]
MADPTPMPAHAEQPIDVYVIAPPTTNGPLHLGHLSGPYLAADIVSRAARNRGDRTLTIGGVDVHPNWVLTRAENEGIDVEKLIWDFRQRIDEALFQARVNCDVYLDPQQSSHQQAVARLAAHLADNYCEFRELTLHACTDCGRTLHNSYVVGSCSRCGSHSNGGTCEGCGGYASAQDLIDPRCNRCGGAPKEFQARIPVLVMEKFHAQLEETWQRIELPRRIRDLIAGYLADGLPEIPLGYPTNWGVEGVGSMAGLRLDVNVELGLSTYHCASTGIDPSVDSVEAERVAWEQIGKLWHFHGIDNGFYFALLWPALYAALGVRSDQIGGTVVNEFYTLDGLKFSTSRAHAIWADELLSSQDPDIVRLYLAWDRPDRYQSDFTMAAFEDFRDWVAPLLAGTATVPAQPAGLVTPDLIRGLDALRAKGYDSALAARCLLANLGSQHEPRWQLLRSAICGSTDGSSELVGAGASSSPSGR